MSCFAAALAAALALQPGAAMAHDGHLRSCPPSHRVSDAMV
jgi:hypothetical protein